MKRNPIDKTPGAFELRMEKRRRMFEIMGMESPEYSRSKDKEEMFQQSVINCYSCQNEDLCSAWLRDNIGAKYPPEFCTNHDLIHEFLARKIQNPIGPA